VYYLPGVQSCFFDRKFLFYIPSKLHCGSANSEDRRSPAIARHRLHTLYKIKYFRIKYNRIITISERMRERERGGEDRLTYHDDDKVEPAPGISEILPESQSQPLDQHLEEEDHSEYSVHVVQYVLQNRSLLKMNVLQSLQSGMFARLIASGMRFYLTDAE
jgi:hypothetical protein